MSTCVETPTGRGGEKKGTHLTEESVTKKGFCWQYRSRQIRSGQVRSDQIQIEIRTGQERTGEER